LEFGTKDDYDIRLLRNSIPIGYWSGGASYQYFMNKKDGNLPILGRDDIPFDLYCQNALLIDDSNNLAGGLSANNTSINLETRYSQDLVLTTTYINTNSDPFW